MAERSILLIYTGGTIGMVQDHRDGQLHPFGFTTLLDNIPELKRFDVNIETAQLSRIIDSSDMDPSLWQELTDLIQSNYDKFDGFVILHGTDTLAFTASALSFMIQGLNKPIVLTGSQLPIGTIRTDGKENLITAIEVASALDNGVAMVPEVSVYFEYSLMRGNRVTKYSAEHFDAFHSPNYPVLAEAGIQIVYDRPYIRRAALGKPIFYRNLDVRIAVLKLFPGIDAELVRAIVFSGAKGLIMETYGSGNAMSAPWFTDILKEAVDKGLIILNVTQCLAGTVEHGRYATSAKFEEIGIISGTDIRFEAAVTKMMHALAQSEDKKEIERILKGSIAGEIQESH